MYYVLVLLHISSKFLRYAFVSRRCPFLTYFCKILIWLDMHIVLAKDTRSNDLNQNKKLQISFCFLMLFSCLEMLDRYLWKYLHFYMFNYLIFEAKGKKASNFSNHPMSHIWKDLSAHYCIQCFKKYSGIFYRLITFYVSYLLDISRSLSFSLTPVFLSRSSHLISGKGITLP